MKDPHRTSEGAGKYSGAADTEIIASGDACPYALDCRRITPCTYTDSAACNFCGQHLDRALLLEVYAGGHS